MSIHLSQEIKCPKCGNKTRVEIWKSLNASVDPKAKRDLIEGKINWFECKNCGWKGEVVQDLIYHDQERKFMVLYIPFIYIENDSFFRKKGYVDEFTPEGKFQSFRRFERKISEKFILPYMKDIHIVLSIGELMRYIIFRDKLTEYKKSINIEDKKR